MQRVSNRYDFCVRWKPYLLKPNIPKGGLPKPTAPSGLAKVHHELKTAGNEVGIDFTGKCPVYPSSVQAHILLELVKEDPRLQNEVAETLFKSYFTDGSVLDEEAILKIAEQHGLNVKDVQDAITDESKQEYILKCTALCHQQGVIGVPFFYMNGQRTFSGAQEPEAFVKMFEIIAEKLPLPPSTDMTRSSAKL